MNWTNSVVRLLWDDIGAGRSPCTEPAHNARSRLVKCEVCIAGASEMELGAKSNALAVNDGGAHVMGKEGINCVLFCSMVSPKAASSGSRVQAPGQCLWTLLTLTAQHQSQALME